MYEQTLLKPKSPLKDLLHTRMQEKSRVPARQRITSFSQMRSSLPPTWQWCLKVRQRAKPTPVSPPTCCPVTDIYLSLQSLDLRCFLFLQLLCLFLGVTETRLKVHHLPTLPLQLSLQLCLCLLQTRHLVLQILHKRRLWQWKCFRMKVLENKQTLENCNS